MKIDFCIRNHETGPDGGSIMTTQFALTWEDEDVIEGGWRLPLFTEEAEGAMLSVAEVLPGRRRTRAYYHVSLDKMKLFGKFVDEEAP